MKKLLLLLPFLMAFTAPPEHRDELRVMTFNIRLDVASDAPNDWPRRRDVAAQTIRESGADLVGTQEVLANQLDDLLARLPDYAHIGVGRQDGRRAGEFSAILYRTDRFRPIRSGTFWLSPTPTVAGSKGWDAACERVATWAIMNDLQTGRRLMFINTHFDHVGQRARRESATMLLHFADSAEKGLPVVISGDFNVPDTSDVIRSITAAGFTDCAAAVGCPDCLRGTWHDFGRQPVEKRRRIDFIFTSPEFVPTGFDIHPDYRDSVYVTDHSVLSARIRYK